MERSITNLHGNEIKMGAHVYYGREIAEVISIGRKIVKVTFIGFNFKKVVRSLNVTKFHLPLIYNP